MNNPENTLIVYFGFGSNRDLEMMEHMIGRKNISGEKGKLIGYELCIQKAYQFRDIIPSTNPINISPRSLIVGAWGSDFEMYVSRPNPDGVIYGTIWYITPEELNLVKEWEMVDYGAQENAKGIAINSKGELIGVITQSFLKPPIPEIYKVITGSDYENYIAPKIAMLKKADETRLIYLNAIKKQRNQKILLF